MSGQQIAVISLEGVLQAEGTGAPIQTGIALYHALNLVYVTAISFRQEPWERPPKAIEWMGKEGLYDHQYLYAHLAGTPRASSLTDMRRAQHAPVLWIDASPASVAELVKEGITSLLFTSPVYARPEHRPDHESEVRPWDTLVDEMEHAAELRANDTRMLP